MRRLPRGTKLKRSKSITISIGTNAATGSPAWSEQREPLTDQEALEAIRALQQLSQILTLELATHRGISANDVNDLVNNHLIRID